MKLKQLFLMAGDILILYISLFLVLFLRYGSRLQEKNIIEAHVIPFSIIFFLWIIIFYIAGLYDIKSLKTTFSFVQQLVVSIFAGTVLAITLFYTVRYFSISPKTTLAIFVILYSLLEVGWRVWFNARIKTPQNNVLAIGTSGDMRELVAFISQNPQTGFRVIQHLETKENYNDAHAHIDLIITDRADAIPSRFDGLEALARIQIMDTQSAYEMILRKTPLQSTDILKLLRRTSQKDYHYEFLQYPLHAGIAALLTLATSPLLLLLGILVKITSRGPIIYKQTRLGRYGTKFNIYKFRTMRQDAEKNGAVWAQKNDPRVTRLGKFLRYSHLDELPQLFNIMRGEIAFVGPRPERPELAAKIEEAIPLFPLRLAVRPGLTGWAQINHRYSFSQTGADLQTEDTKEKLQYDLFYIKEQSLLMDFLIVLKTIKMFVFNFQ